MKKIILPILILILLCQIGLSENICQDVIRPDATCKMLTPSLSCTNYDYSIYDKNQNTTSSGNLTNFKNQIYYFNFSESRGNYIIELCDGTTREIEVGGKENMSSLSITLFVLGISSLLFFFGMNKKQLSNNIVTNLIIKRSLIVLSIFLMIQNSAIMAEIAVVGGLDLTREMFMYMFIFGWAGYGLLVYLIVKTIIDMLTMIKQRKQMERTGEI